MPGRSIHLIPTPSAPTQSGGLICDAQLMEHQQDRRDCGGANFEDSALKRATPGQSPHPTSFLDGPNVSHREMWSYLRRYLEVWCHCLFQRRALDFELAFQLKVSGYLLNTLPDCEERRSFISTRNISGLQKSPTASPSSSMVGTSSKYIAPL